MGRPIIREWPPFLSRPNVARALDMEEEDIERALAMGDIPQPVLIGGMERWRLAEIERIGAVQIAEPKWRRNLAEKASQTRA